MVPRPLESLKSTLWDIYGSMWFMVIFFCKANQVRFFLKPNCSTPEKTHTHPSKTTETTKFPQAARKTVGRTGTKVLVSLGNVLV